MLLRLTVFLFACPLFLSAGGSTQDVADHMRVVRNHNAEITDKLMAMNALLNLGSDAQRQLCAQLERDCKSLRADFEKSRAKLVGDFALAAPRVIEERLNREATESLDEWRTTILEHSRDQSLTKEMIVNESDPALANIEGLLSVKTREVYDENPDLYALLIATRDIQSEERVYYGFWSRSGKRLQATPEGNKIYKRLEQLDDPRPLEDALYKELDLLAKFAIPMTAGDRQVLAANREIAGEVEPAEAEGNEILNLMRIRLGLGAVRCDPKLHSASRGHSKDMVDHGFFSHTSPVPGKEQFTQRAALAGTSASSENIAQGQKTPAAAILGWWHSPGHHRNMLGAGHARVGLGRHANTWTQMFGR